MLNEAYMCMLVLCHVSLYNRLLKWFAGDVITEERREKESPRLLLSLRHLNWSNEEIKLSRVSTFAINITEHNETIMINNGFTDPTKRMDLSFCQQKRGMLSRCYCSFILIFEI